MVNPVLSCISLLSVAIYGVMVEVVSECGIPVCGTRVHTHNCGWATLHMFPLTHVAHTIHMCVHVDRVFEVLLIPVGYS